jgi:hypothetical protein
MHNIIRVKSYADIETISRATDAQPSVPHDFLSTIRRISDIHRKNGSRNSAPAVNFGAYMPDLSISSGDSDEDQTFLNCLKGIQTSTPQTANKRLPIAGPSSAPSSSSRRVANTSTPNVPLSLTKRSANKALKPLPNILMNQTLTPIGRSVESPKPSTVIKSEFGFELVLIYEFIINPNIVYNYRISEQIRETEDSDTRKDYAISWSQELYTGV